VKGVEKTSTKSVYKKKRTGLRCGGRGKSEITSALQMCFLVTSALVNRTSDHYGTSGFIIRAL